MSGGRMALPLVALVVLAVPAWAERRQEPSLSQNQRTLKETQQQLRKERAKAVKAKRREAGLLSELEGIERELAKTRRELGALERQIRKAQAEVLTLEGGIGRLESRQSGQQEVLARRLRLLHKLRAQGGVLPWIVGSKDPMARAVQLRHLATLAAVDARLIREYRDTSEELAQRKGRVEEERRKLSSLKGRLERERAEVNRQAARRRKLLATVRENRAYHERMAAELTEAAKRLEALVRELQARQRRTAKAPPRDGGATPAVGFGLLRGSLPWPTEGRIVTTFGEQVHPRFGTRTFKRGVDIEAEEGAGIAAVASGHVVYTGWFKGYGNLIILDHDNDFYTLYAHAAEIHVGEGEDVRQGQVIGTVGETGSLSGPRLYFEVRYQGRPQNPAEWLRRRG